ncbi:MAG: TolB family protein [Chitinophagaceae bacterium]
MKLFHLLLSVCFQISTFAQNNSDIILFEVVIKPTGIILSNPVNITNHKGYDNQPFFHNTNIYYSSAADSGQMDIRRYDYLKKTTYTIRHTEENEFSPTITPDGKFISCILQRKNGKQDLVKYPVKGGEAIIIIDNLKVGYHAWADDNNLLLFVLEDTTTFGLHYYNTITKEDKKLATDIGRSLQKIPGKQAVSFIQKSPTDWFIKKYNVITKTVSTVITALPNREYLTWGKKGLILMSDGKEIYFSKPGSISNWQKIKIIGDVSLKNISRLAINEQNTRLAVVVAE